MAAPTLPDSPASNIPSNGDRAALRQRLLAHRREWADTPQAASAQQQLQQRVWTVLAQLEPDCLGVFWPMQGEFNPLDVALKAQQQWRCRLALPYARRHPVAMHFTLWDGVPPTEKDECGIPALPGAPLVPDVLLVPCLGFSERGWRLGYGGGYFDRYLAAHPHVTAIGVCWDAGRLEDAAIAPQPHDQRLMAVITESNIFSV